MWFIFSELGKRNLKSLCDITKGSVYLKCKRKKTHTHRNTHAANTFQMTNAHFKFHTSKSQPRNSQPSQPTEQTVTRTRMQRSSYPLTPSLFDLLQKNKSSSSSPLSSSSNAQLQPLRSNSSNLKQDEVHRPGQETACDGPGDVS